MKQCVRKDEKIAAPSSRWGSGATTEGQKPRSNRDTLNSAETRGLQEINVGVCTLKLL